MEHFVVLVSVSSSINIVNERQWLSDGVKPDKLLCYMFLLAFLALTVHRPQQWFGVTDQQKLSC